MVLRVEVDAENVPFVRINDKIVLRLDLEEFDENFLKRIGSEHKETLEIVENSLKALKTLISEEKALYMPLDDDQFLLKFLRPFNFEVATVFKIIKKYYKYKVKYPEFEIITPDTARHAFDSEVFMLLPTRTEQGSRLFLINAGSKWNPKITPLEDLLRASMVAVEIGMMEPKTQVAGGHLIINFDGFSLKHIYYLSPSKAKRILEWIQECIPVKLRGIHFINQSIFFNMGYAIFKPFIGEKLKKKIFFYGSNRKALADKLGAANIPQYIGGNGSLPEYPGNLASEMLYYYESKFERLSSYGYPFSTKLD